MKEGNKKYFNFNYYDLLIIVITLLLFTSGFTIYWTNKPASPSFSIGEVTFKLSEVQRTISFNVTAQRGMIELKEVSINNVTVGWNADKAIVGQGQTANCSIEYNWKSGEYYDIELTTVDDRSAESVARAPVIVQNISLDVENVNLTLNSGSLTVTANYEVQGNGTNNIQMLLFSYQSFEESNRSLYIFYDPEYMTNESLNRAETIVNYFEGYGIVINKADYNDLEQLAQREENIILILVDPLKSNNGNSLTNAIPAPLVDPNNTDSGYLSNESKYGRSFLYDWMNDKGLVLVTIGSSEPYKRILYSDGVYTYAKDSVQPFDADKFLTNSSGKASIIKGDYMMSDYNPVRIDGTLGLSYRDSYSKFDKDAMAIDGLEYYAYGDYSMPKSQGNLNLTLPVFIKVGSGGWLAMGDDEYYLLDQSLAHDFFMLYLQSVWDSSWIPFGLYWDSGGTFVTNNYGIIKMNGTLETEAIPSALLDNGITIRIIAVAQSTELNKGVVVEQTSQYNLP
ncbi:MAG: hypothetical protein ABSB40_04640 [Nitrososphaeria archaeon]|jgi:hypothetical protein